MADAPSSLGSNKIIKVGEGKDLRKVEEDVLIPRIMKKHAMERCSEHVKAFEDCVRGRVISVLWACQETNKQMQNCIQTLYKDEDFRKECTEEYLQKRDEFRRTGVRTSTRKNKETERLQSSS